MLASLIIYLGRIGIAFFGLLLVASPAVASLADEQEIERLDKIEQELSLQRDWADYRWKKANAECYKRFFVNSCLNDARIQHRKEIDPIREQEVELNANQRVIRERIKTERDATRAAERANPEKTKERADNQREFEQKQKDKAARAADLEERRKDAPRRAQENKAGAKLD